MIVPDRVLLKIARAKADTVDGVATITLKIPGTPGSGTGRAIIAGECWFETQDFDDVVEIHISDEDNILGGGAGAIVDSFTDTDVDAVNQGWYINKHKKMGFVEAVVFSELIPSGLYLKIVGTTGDTRLDILRLNITWGKRK